MSSWCCNDDVPSPTAQFLLFIAGTEKAGATTVLRRTLHQQRCDDVASTPTPSQGVPMPTILEYEMFGTSFEPHGGVTLDKKRSRGTPFTLVDVGRSVRAELLLSFSNNLSSTHFDGVAPLPSSLSTSLRPRSSASSVSSSPLSSSGTVQLLLGKATGVVFVVDCTEKSQAGGSSSQKSQSSFLTEAHHHSLSSSQVLLFAALRSAITEASIRRRIEIPLYVCANKQDVASSASVRDVVECLGMKAQDWPISIPWTCQPCAAVCSQLALPRGICEYFASFRHDGDGAAGSSSAHSTSALDGKAHIILSPTGSSGSPIVRRRAGSDAELTQRLSSSNPASPRAGGDEGPLSKRAVDLFSVSVTLPGSDSELAASRRRNYVPLDR